MKNVSTGKYFVLLKAEILEMFDVLKSISGAILPDTLKAQFLSMN